MRYYARDNVRKLNVSTAQYVQTVLRQASLAEMPKYAALPARSCVSQRSHGLHSKVPVTSDYAG